MTYKQSPLKSNPLAAYILLCWIWVGWKLVRFIKRSYESIGNNTRRSCAFQLHFGCSPFDFKFDFNCSTHLNNVAQCIRFLPNKLHLFRSLSIRHYWKNNTNIICKSRTNRFLFQKWYEVYNFNFICRSYIGLNRLLKWNV